MLEAPDIERILSPRKITESLLQLAMLWERKVETARQRVFRR